MEYIFSSLEIIAEVINVLGIVVLIFGFTREFIKFILIEFKNGIMATPIESIQKIRCQIGIYILLALDFLIVSDIIRSIVELSFDELIKLSVTIALRIAMGYFLGEEINELEQE